MKLQLSVPQQHLRGLEPSPSNWRCLFTSHCMVLHQRTCQTTVNLSLTWDVDISDLLTSTRVLSRGHIHRLATGVSL